MQLHISPPQQVRAFQFTSASGSLQPGVPPHDAGPRPPAPTQHSTPLLPPPMRHPAAAWQKDCEMVATAMQRTVQGFLPVPWKCC